MQFILLFNAFSPNQEWYAAFPRLLTSFLDDKYSELLYYNTDYRPSVRQSGDSTRLTFQTSSEELLGAMGVASFYGPAGFKFEYCRDLDSGKIFEIDFFPKIVFVFVWSSSSRTHSRNTHL